MKQIMFLVLMLLAFPVQVYGFSAQARVDRNRIAQDQSLTLEIIVKGGDAVVDISVIKDFRVVSRGTSTSVSIINGAYSKSITHQYVLLPQGPGSLTIPPLPVTLDGEIAYTDKIIVHVVKGQVNQTHDGDIFARATLSSTTLVPGQQAIYTFRLYNAVQIANPRLAQPDFSGFSAKQAPKQESFNETINGRNYNVTELSYVLIAEKPGEFEIEPSVVTCDIPVAAPNNPFGDPFFGNRLFSMGRNETRRFATESFKVKVNPMPDPDPDPGNGVVFSGLVGHFSLGAGLDSESVKAGESVTLTLTVSGTGNIMDAAIPALNLPHSFKVYDDVPQEKINLTQEGYQGEKIFKRAIVPMEPGEFVLEPVKLSYFNLETGTYDILSTPALTLSVEPSEKAVPPLTANSSNDKKKEVKKEEVQFTGDDILALKEGATVLIPHKELSLVVFSLLLVLPLFLLFVFWAGVKILKKEDSFSVLLNKRARQSLKSAGKKDLSREAFLRNLYTALVAGVRSKGEVPGETLTTGELSEILFSAGCDQNRINEAIAMLNDIESVQYGGALFDSGLRKKLFQRAKHIVTTLGIALVCLSFFSFMPGSARADDSGTLFLAGINLYKAGQFQDAAAKFEQVAANGVKNGELYYNIGNSFLKAGETGPAILWYERAKKLIPLDPDLKYNLDHARGRVTDALAEKNINIDIMELLFFWDNYLPPGVVQYGGIILWLGFIIHVGNRIVRKKKVFTLAGSLLFILAVVVISTAFFNYYQQYSQSHAIILAREAPVRSGYSDQATELFLLHAGTKVRVERKEGEFLRISFSKDKVGWIRASLAGII